jgi:hypothetical protein
MYSVQKILLSEIPELGEWILSWTTTWTPTRRPRQWQSQKPWAWAVPSTRTPLMTPTRMIRRRRATTRSRTTNSRLATTRCATLTGPSTAPSARARRSRITSSRACSSTPTPSGSRKTVSALASQIETKNQHLLDLETKNATEFSTSRLEEDSRKLHEAYNEGTLSICSLFFLWLLMVKRNLVNLHFC